VVVDVDLGQVEVEQLEQQQRPQHDETLGAMMSSCAVECAHMTKLSSICTQCENPFRNGILIGSFACVLESKLPILNFSFPSARSYKKVSLQNLQ
jgi:hypothetical protein